MHIVLGQKGMGGSLSAHTPSEEGGLTHKQSTRRLPASVSLFDESDKQQFLGIEIPRDVQLIVSSLAQKLSTGEN